MKIMGRHNSLYARILATGVVISALAIPLFMLAKENTRRQVQQLANGETGRYFEAAFSVSMLRSEQMTRACAEAFSGNITKGEKLDRALAMAVKQVTTESNGLFVWCVDDAGYIYCSVPEDAGYKYPGSLRHENPGGRVAWIAMLDNKPHILATALANNQSDKIMCIVMAFPLESALTNFDRDKRFTAIEPAVIMSSGSNGNRYPVKDANGKIICTVDVRPATAETQSDIAGWELVALAALPLFAFFVFLYLLYRHFDSLSAHFELLRRTLRREKPGVEIFRRDHQVVKSTMPELSEIFALVDENQGEKSRLKRSIDIMTAAMELIREKGYGQDAIDGIVEMVVTSSSTYGGAVFLFDPLEEKIEAVGKSNLTNDVITGILQAPISQNFINLCRRQGSQLIHLDMKSPNFEKSFEGIFKGFSHVYCIPLSFKTQLTGFLLLVSIGPEPGEELRDGVTALIGDALAAILYGLAMEKEKSARLDKTRILQETSLAISSTLELPSVLQIVATRLTEYAGGTYCVILLNTEVENVLEVASFHTKRQNGVGAPDMSRINLVEFPKLNEAMSSRRTIMLGIQDEGDLTKAEKGFFKMETVKLLTIIPISHSAKSIGVVVLGEERIRSRSSVGSERLNFVHAVVSQAASAIENARLYGFINKRVDQLTVLYNASAAIHSEINISSMLDKVLGATREFLHYSSAAVFAVDEKRNLLPPMVSSGIEIEFSTNRKIDSAAVSAAQLAASSGESIIVEDMRVESDFQPTFPKTLSEISVPIMMGERLLGVFSVGSTSKCSYGRVDENFLKALAGQIAVALERARLFDRERERGLKLKTIFDFSRKLSRSLNAQEVLRLASTSIQEAFGYQLVAVFLIDHTNKQFHIGHQSSATQKRLPDDFIVPIGQGLLGGAAEKRKTTYCSDVRSEPTYVVAVDDVKSEVCIPIVVAERVIGILDVESMEIDDFTPEDINTLEALADIMAVAIDNSFLFGETIEKAERLALIDDINKAISATLDLDSFFRVVARAVADNAGYRWTALVVPENGSFAFKAGYTPKSVGTISTENMLGMLRQKLLKVIESVKPELVSFPQMVTLGGPEKLQSMVDAGIRSLALFPIGDTTRAEAVMIVGSSNSEGFSNQELALLKDLAVHLRIAWQNAQLYRQLKDAYEQLQDAQDRMVQTEKLRALGEMSSGVVHDFNNILAAILGRIQIVARKLDGFEAWSGRQFLEKNLDLIEKAANDGSEILSRISEFTKKKPSEKFVELQIDQIISDTIELTRPRWHDYALSIGKSIDVEFQRTGQLQTTGSPSELREVFTNLINNAVDAIPGMGKINIEARQEETSIRITIADTGEGMPPETRKKIFEPFFTTKGAHGTGLGLSVTYGIITRHKGTIEVESELGQGTKFAIVIPIRQQGQDETRFTELPAITPTRGTSILVVDDQEQFREVVAEILQSGGHDVESAGDGEEALQILAGNVFDIVITDLGMSGLSGWELADKIYMDYPGTKIIIATGWGANLDEETLRAHHIFSLICKPFKIDEILSAVEKALGARGSEVLIDQH
jgi:signal transduction histidine kinase/putative methionine-R-sulfoxide reductase with GAF domain/ActR/RegA family two-component response regulator